MAERVLVTGARAAAALDIARALRAAGFEPHLADCSPARLARWSNSAGPVHRYASPVTRPDAFAADVRALVRKLEPVRIIPACEEVFHLAALAETDAFLTALFAPSLALLADLHAKDRFIALCDRLDLPAPETCTVTDADTLSAAVQALGDVVVKPVWSRFGSRTLVSPSTDQLSNIAPTPATPWVVQRRITGEDVSFYAVFNDGGVNAFAAYGSDCRARGGAALSFRPLDASAADRLRPFAGALASHVDRGQISCDAVVDAEGRPWLIECNPRATSGVHLFAPADLGRALAGEGEAVSLDEPRCVAPALWGKRVSAKARSALGRDVVSAPGDPLPTFGALADAAVFALRAVKTRRPLTEAMTADIEWNGQPLNHGRKP